MKTIKWLLVFAGAFCIALILVLTFMQPAFKQEVGAQIMTYKTRAVPVYLYVLGAFIFGLLIGLSAAVFGFISAKSDSFKKNKKIRALELELAEAKKSVVPPLLPVSDNNASGQFPVPGSFGAPK